MRSEQLFLVGLSTLAALLVALVAGGRFGDDSGRAARRELAAALALTDFALGTEARYTRHPSQADFFAPFQDGPGSLEHFPAGSVMYPPPGAAGGGGPILVRRAGPAAGRAPASR